MSQSTPETGLDEPTVIENWTPDSVAVDLDVGVAGFCERCETPMKACDGEELRIICPDCKLVIGFVLSFPSIDGYDGVPSAESDWPTSKVGWEVADGRARVSYFVRGKHLDCDTEFVEDDYESPLGTTGGECCPDCNAQLGYAVQSNVLEDPQADEEGEA